MIGSRPNQISYGSAFTWHTTFSLFFLLFLSHIFYLSRLQCQVIHLITLSTFQLELPLIISDMGKLSSDEVSYAVELIPCQVSCSRFFFIKISYLFPSLEVNRRIFFLIFQHRRKIYKSPFPLFLHDIYLKKTHTDFNIKGFLCK